MNIKKVVSAFELQISKLSSVRSSFCLHPEKDFTRNRKVPFEFTMRSILSFGGGTLTNELLKITKFASTTPTSSAFIQQRNKISYKAFSELFSMINSEFDQDLRYKGYRLMAVDGSHIHVPTNPNDFESYVKCREDERPHNEFHLNAMFDIKQGIYMDVVVQKYRTQNEDKALIDMTERSQLTDAIAICDRGYESYNIMAHLQKSNWKYIIRIKEPGHYGIASGLELPNSNEYDMSVNLSLTRKKNQKIKELLKEKNCYRYISSKVNFDYLPSKTKRNEPAQFYTLNFRIVRIRIDEDNYELLVTNLPKDDFSAEELKKLYAMRWGIETSFRSLKYMVGMLQFHARKSEFVTQEIYANLIMYNMTQIVANCIEVPPSERKYQYKISFSIAANIVKSLLLSDISPPDAEILLRKNLTPIRQNRKYMRNPRAKAQIKFTYRVA